MYKIDGNGEMKGCSFFLAAVEQDIHLFLLLLEDLVLLLEDAVLHCQSTLDLGDDDHLGYDGFTF